MNSKLWRFRVKTPLRTWPNPSPATRSPSQCLPLTCTDSQPVAADRKVVMASGVWEIPWMQDWILSTETMVRNLQRSCLVHTACHSWWPRSGIWCTLHILSKFSMFSQSRRKLIEPVWGSASISILANLYLYFLICCALLLDIYAFISIIQIAAKFESFLISHS